MIARRALPGLLAAAALLRPRLAVPQVDPDAALIAAAHAVFAAFERVQDPELRRAA